MKRRLLFALLVCAVLFLSACKRSAPPPPPLTGEIPVSVVPSARVGDSVSVTLGPMDAVNGTPVLLTVLTTYGPRVLTAAFANQYARILLDETYTKNSGQLSLLAQSGDARGQAQVQLVADAPVEPLTPLVGPRSIIADGEHWSMATGIPFDRFGNPAADGTPVKIRVLHPDNRLEELDVTVQHLVAWARIFSGTQAGRTNITMQAESAYGPEETLLEVAGMPVPFKVNAAPNNVPADGRQLVTMRTEILRDKFGNTMADGTAVTFFVKTASGQLRLIPAYTLAGAAEAPLQAPTEPGIVEVWGTLYGVESLRTDVTFTPGPAVGEIPVQVIPNAADHSLRLKAGPIIGMLKQYVPDGTPVQFSLTDPTGFKQWLTATTEQGYATAEVRMPELPIGSYHVEVLAGSGYGKKDFELP